MHNEFEAALYLFDGDKEKANILMELLKGASYGIPEKFNVQMDFSEPSCRWCNSRECWYFMPDSKLICEHNKKECFFYEENN